MPHPLIADILTRLNDEAVAELALASRIEHPSESGRARERVVSRFLGKLLPDQIGIDTGFVIDAIGGKSRQIDIVIYRRDYHPVFEIGGVKHFMAEAVLAVVENKATIDSRDSLRVALENVASVKGLDRTNRGTNYRVTGKDRGPAIDLDRFNDQIFGAVSTSKGLAAESLEDVLLDFIAAHSRREWPNFYADLGGRAAFYAMPDGRGGLASTARTEAAVALAVRGLPEYPGVRPLVELGSEIANFVRVAVLVDFSPKDYLELAGAARKVDFRSTTQPSSPPSDTPSEAARPPAGASEAR